ncbi:MAG: enoyl-CoA hydratase/isomerase family protein [Bacteroidetes bacterium]|nr:enoyl-CoA hydratase/isomerase family protein [Bacteroidota bacterium]
MSFSTVRFDVDDQGIGLITISRPEKLNALNATVLDELDECFSAANETDDIRGVIVTGEGPKAFVAGADIQEFADLNPEDAEDMARRGQSVFQRIEDMLIPVIAAVNGFALGGGCELAISCHMRIASDNAAFAQPEVNLGLIPGYGGTQRLPRLIGRGNATEMLLTGDMIDASRAYEIGLVNKVVALDELLESSKTLMTTIISRAPVAISLVLEAIRASYLPPDEGLRREATLFGQACETEDFKEGVSAFLEKRPAAFQGR